MLVCVDCRKEMKCEKNGVGARFGESHVYPGDLYVCPECGKKIVLTNKESVHDPEKKIFTVKMDEN